MSFSVSPKSRGCGWVFRSSGIGCVTPRFPRVSPVGPVGDYRDVAHATVVWLDKNYHPVRIPPDVRSKIVPFIRHDMERWRPKVADSKNALSKGTYDCVPEWSNDKCTEGVSVSLAKN
uniref:Putative hotDog domain-containing protein n=1 Tax=Helianthus annuus TaxID=4232 RepID=A0A251U9D0_HELAN